MKTRTLILAGSLFTLPIVPITAAHAQSDTLDVKSPIPFKGIAKIVVMKRKTKEVTMRSEYPQFLQNTPLTRLANLKIRTSAQSIYQNFLADFQKDKKEGNVGMLPYEYQQQPQLYYYYAPRLISTTRVYDQYRGGAHGFGATVATNFGQFPGMRAPKMLTLGDFFTGTTYRKTIEKKIIDKLRANKQQEASWILDGTVKTLTPSQLNNFTVTSKGLTWYFEPYAVGPYAAGEFDVTLTVNELTSDFKRAVVLGR